MTTTVQSNVDLAERVFAVVAVNKANGWHDGNRTLGEGLALIHSEIGEALEAFRDHGLKDATRTVAVARGDDGSDLAKPSPAKPEGVGSELADVYIRVLDQLYRIGVADPWVYISSPIIPNAEEGETFGDALAYLHAVVAQASRKELSQDMLARILVTVLTSVARVATKFGLDLDAEYERKHAYNATRGYRHGRLKDTL